jgi:type IV pilus assembly protein PilA
MNFFLKSDNQNRFKTLILLAFFMLIGVIFALIIQDLVTDIFSNKNWAISAEARASVGTMNRGQQSYLLVNKGIFAKSLNELDVNIKEQTSNYKYSIKVTKISAFNYADARLEYVRKGWFKKIPVIGYVGAIFIVPTTKNSKNELTTLVIICQNKLPGTTHSSDPIYQNGILRCGVGTIKLQR